MPPELIPSCKTYLPDHWKNLRSDFPALQFWELIGAKVFLQRVIADLRRYKVAAWVPTEWSEQTVGNLIELCLYASPDDLSAGHQDLDLALLTWWAPVAGLTPPSLEKKILKIDLGIVDQSENIVLLNGTLWAQPTGEWYWEEKPLAELSFWMQARWAERFKE